MTFRRFINLKLLKSSQPVSVFFFWINSFMIDFRRVENVLHLCNSMVFEFLGVSVSWAFPEEVP